MLMSDPPWIWRCDQSIPSDTEAGRRLLDELLGQLAEQGWTEREIFAVQLAVEEALINAIRHGNRFSRMKQVHFQARLARDRVRVEVADEGAGFDPGQLPDPTDAEYLEAPSGRGVMLMRAFMSRVEYNERGNCVLLERQREG